MVERKLSRQDGFTLLEVVLAASLSVMLLAVVAGAYAAFRSSIRITGHDTVAGETLSINPDDSVTTAARALTTEFLSLTQEGRFVICADSPWNANQAAATPLLPALGGLDAATLRDPAATKSALASAGLLFDNSGYTVFVIGAGMKVQAALTVQSQNVTVTNGDSFRRYTVMLFTSDVAGYGALCSYDFISPASVAQTYQRPVLNSGVWRFSLPDPSLPSDLPDGSAVTIMPASALVYETVAHF